MRDFKPAVDHFHETAYKDKQDIYEALARTHSPHTLVITCGDSRINVESLLQAAPAKFSKSEISQISYQNTTTQTQYYPYKQV